MNIQKQQEQTKLTLMVEGRLDTTTSPSLEAEIRSSIEGITELILDFAKLEYISSAGLRVLLSTQKLMGKKGSLVLRNVSGDVNEVFELTGFSDILTIES